jgi:hypothetical protein
MATATSPQHVASDERQGDYIQTFGGRAYWPLDPRAEEVELEDIAHALSNQCRYSGHTRTFYSVAEHSVRVMRLCGPDRIIMAAALMHDAAEAYLVDLPRPLKHHSELGRAYMAAEAINHHVIMRRFGLPIGNPELDAIVADADNRLLATEVRDLMWRTAKKPDGSPVWSKWLDGIVPLPGTIKPWPPEMARRIFLSEARELGLE